MSKELVNYILIAIAFMVFIVAIHVRGRKHYDHMTIVPSWFTPSRTKLRKRDWVLLAILVTIEAVSLAATCAFFAWLIIMAVIAY